MKKLILLSILLIVGCGDDLIEDITGRYPNGKIQSIEYYQRSNNELVKKIEYYDNGQIKENGGYNDGLMDGLWIYYYKNGQMKGKGHFKKGDGTKFGTLGIPRYGRDKLWTFWYENGQEEDQVTYVEGIKNGLTINWYETGQKRMEGLWKNSQLDGKWTWYYENGQIHKEENFKDRKLDSKLIEYYENGNIYVQGSFKKGIVDKYSFTEEGRILIGEWIYYNEDGSIRTVENYKDRRRILEELTISVLEGMTEPMVINLEFAKYLFDEKIPIFIDARDVEDYEEGHIENAVNIPYDYYEDYEEIMDALDDDGIYIIYSSGEECSLGFDLADYLFNEMVYEKLLIFEGGWSQW